MKKKSPPISLFVGIAVIGLLISFINGDFAIGPIMEGTEGYSLEALLDEINLILGFVALAGVLIFWIWRATREDKGFYWEFDKDQDQDDEII